ncbi:hypothetical protein BaRGS_00016242 [Batillaria attramentaria]|uniref:Uncharacterized protein n=1 Tax=Batillaria attramentaria TaxID=370345 RepID=A0ABD0KZX8_9CAEN
MERPLFQDPCIAFSILTRGAQNGSYLKADSQNEFFKHNASNRGDRTFTHLTLRMAAAAACPLVGTVAECSQEMNTSSLVVFLGKNLTLCYAELYSFIKCADRKYSMPRQLAWYSSVW